MKNNDYYNYYEILFSLRKEYLKNQELINKLLSYIKITNDPLEEYNSSMIFKTNSKTNLDSLLLIVKKRQSSIRQILDSIYNSIVYSDPDLRPGYFSYKFYLTKNYAYLIDDTQDGRYLKAKVEITNQNEFVQLYKQIINNTICKKGRSYFILKNEIIRLSNNGVHLFHIENEDYKKSVNLDYNGLDDSIITNNTSCLDKLMKLKIDKNIIPNYYKNIIDSNMEDYLYTIEGNKSKDEGLYTIEGYEKKLILKPYK